MKRTRIKSISKKRQGQMSIYHDLIEQIRPQDNRSELSGELPDWQSGGIVEAHHINGRIGTELINARNIIFLTREEHADIHAHNTYERKQELLAIVEPIRIKQGW